MRPSCNSVYTRADQHAAARRYLPLRQLQLLSAVALDRAEHLARHARIVQTRRHTALPVDLAVDTHGPRIARAVAVDPQHRVALIRGKRALGQQAERRH